MSNVERPREFIEKLEAFLSEHMPEDWKIAVVILVPEPGVEGKYHIFPFDDIQPRDLAIMAVGEWYLRLREGSEHIDDLRKLETEG
jgi:hypothetical protein